jgi:hypothetical protein
VVLRQRKVEVTYYITSVLPVTQLVGHYQPLDGIKASYQDVIVDDEVAGQAFCPACDMSVESILSTSGCLVTATPAAARASLCVHDCMLTFCRCMAN